MRLIRWSLCVGLIVMGSSSQDGHADEPARPDPGSLDSVIAGAVHDGKPLIVEFYTTWCAPCKVFDARVLPDPKVQAELANVRFVRYDAERGSGIAAAEKLRVNAYPSFLAIDDKGFVRLRTSGLSPGESAWFVEFLQHGSVVVGSEDRVLAARKRAPGMHGSRRRPRAGTSSMTGPGRRWPTSTPPWRRTGPTR